MIGVLLALIGYSHYYNIPKQYQGNPDHPVSVIFVWPKDVNTYCGNDTPLERTFLACEKGGTLIMPNPCLYPEMKDVDSYAHLLCHEKAHINGWNHSAQDKQP